MTAVDSGHLVYPTGLITSSGATAWDNSLHHTIDASGEKAAWVFEAQSTDAIIGAAATTRTVAATGLIKWSIQGVNLANGEPDGTVKGGGSPCSIDDVSMSSSSTGYQVTFDNSYTPSARELLALVLETGASWSGGDVDLITFNGMFKIFQFPYGTGQIGGSWSTDQVYGSYAVQHSGDRWYPIAGTAPVDGIAGNIAIDGTPQYGGLKFELPFPATLHAIISNCDADQPFDWELYSSGNPGSPLATLKSTVDPDLRADTGGSTRVDCFATQSLSADTVYRLIIKCSTTDINLYYAPVHSQPAKEAFGIPYAKRTNWHACRDNGAGGWDDSTDALRLPAIALVLSQVDDGAGGGGGGGGMRIVGRGGLVT